MNGYAGNPAPPAMYVRALYNYAADDPTSLSFHKGDVIQVITQLESGWWDGVINGVRGWFPSNYCTVIAGSTEDDDEHGANQESDDADAEDDLRDELDEGDYDDVDSEGNLKDDVAMPIDGIEGSEQEEAAFWIPQATPDGRLFYFNTLTGVSTMELPLETPTSSTESGPRDRTNVFIPESTRPPPEMMAGGYERDEEADYDTSASEAEPISAVEETRGSLVSVTQNIGLPLTSANKPHKPFKRRSFPEDGISPAISMDEMKQGSPTRRHNFDYSNPSYLVMRSAIPLIGTATTSFTTDPIGSQPTPTIARQYFDELNGIPLTWNRLVEDMRRSVERYRQAINNGQRSEFVRRAEDISDHLRLLLAAGSSTTDNHSGNPSIISTNKALYPHFRETMSRFSKLVLSSHIAAADFPPPDSYPKCLKEADGVLSGVYGFVEVARQQRGEEIPRLVPGFVNGSNLGGNWRNNGITPLDKSPTAPFLDQDDYDSFSEPNTTLDAHLIENLRGYRILLEQGIRRLDEQLILQDKSVTPLRHKVIGDTVCKAAATVLGLLRPIISSVESINLTPLADNLQNPQLTEFSVQKQLLYDLISELVISCQAVAAPLADEWAEVRGEPLENRLKVVSMVTKEISDASTQLISTLDLVERLMPADIVAPPKDGPKKIDSAISYESRLRSLSNSERSNVPGAVSDGNEALRNAENAKVKKFFGEVPKPVQPVQSMAEDVPEFLRLDHEGEITYDGKANPPQLRGGTLTGLVEQLTRHDRLDSPFNNTFLLTYRSFTTASELFEMLVNRWKIQPPYGLGKEDYQTWIDRKQKPIRFRVVNILKSWLDSYWMEGNGEEAKQLTVRIYNFAKEHVATTNTPGAAPLIAAVEQRMRGIDAPNKRLVLTLSTTTPQPILPKNMKKLKFLDIDATEFARQLTIIESRLYGKIKPTECMNKSWQRKVEANEPDPAANIKALILHSNQLTNWVAQMILNQADVKRRVIVIKHFVSVADVSISQYSTFSMS
jgi:son of sevenless-like protein